MIEADALSQALFDITLPANGAARLAPPTKTGDQNWWRVGAATWVRALPKRSVRVQKPDETTSIKAHFRTTSPGIKFDKDREWARASDAVKGLAADLVEGILRQLDSSVPALPTRARFLPPSESQLDWPVVERGNPEARQRQRLAGSAALSNYFDNVACASFEKNVSSDAPASDLSERFIRHLSAIPRPAEVRLSLARNADHDPVLSWEQTGNPELLWGAAEISWNDRSDAVVVVQLRSEEAEGKIRLGVWAHLLAMATAVEAATGAVAVPLRMRYRTVGDRAVSADFAISPTQWGFDLPRLVQAAMQGQVPEDFHIHTTG